MASFAEATETSFPDFVLQGPEPVIADFYTPDCISCRKLEAMLAALEKRLQGQIRVIKVNAAETPNLASRYEVRGVPTLLLFKEGGLLDRRSGFLTASNLMEWVEPYLGDKPPA